MAEFEYQPVDQLNFYPPTGFTHLARLRKHLNKANLLGRQIVSAGNQIEEMGTPDPEFYAENREAIANYVRDIPKVIQAMEEMAEQPETKFQPEKLGDKVYQPREQRAMIKKWIAKLTKQTRGVADAALLLKRYTERAEERADGSDLDDEMDRDPEGPRTPSTKSDRGAQPNYGQTMSLDYKWMIDFLRKIEDMRDRMLGERGYYNVEGPIHQTDDAFRSEENIKRFQDLMSYIRSSLTYWRTNMKDFNHELKTYLELRMELTKQMKFAALRKWQARNETREPRTFEQACQEFHKHLGQQRLIRTRMSCTDMVHYKCPRCADDVVRVREHDSARDSRLKNEKNWPKIGASIKCPQCGTEGVHIVEVKEGCGSALAAFPLDMAPGGIPGEETKEGKGIGWKIMCDSYPNFPTNVGVKKAKRTPKGYCECAGIPRFPRDRSIQKDVEKGRDPFNFFEKSLNATDIANDVEQHFIPIVPNEEASALGSKRLIVPNASQTGKIVWEPEKGGNFVAKFTADTDVFEQAKIGDYLMLSAPMQSRYSGRGEGRLDKPAGFTGNFKDHPLDGAYFITKVLSPDTVLISIDSLFNRQFPVESSSGSSMPIQLYNAVFSGASMEMKAIKENGPERLVVTEPDGTWYAMDPSVFTQPVRWALMKIDINNTVDAEQRKWPRWKVEEAKTSLRMLYDRLPDNLETLEGLDAEIEALESEFEWAGGRETDVRKSRQARFKDQEAANALKQMAHDIRALEDVIAKQEAMPISGVDVFGDDDSVETVKYNELADVFTSQMDKLVEILTGVTDKAAIADAIREAEAAQYERMERIRRGELGPSDDLFVHALHELSRSDEASDLARTAEKRFTKLSKFKSITGKRAVIQVTDPETGEQYQLESHDPDAIELRRAYNTFGNYLRQFKPEELDKEGKSEKIPMDRFKAAKDVLVQFGYYTEEQWQRLMEKGWTADDVEPKKMIVSSPEEELPRYAILLPDIDGKVKKALEVMGDNAFVTNVSVVKLGQSDKFGGPPVDYFRLQDQTEAVAMYFTLLMDPKTVTSKGKHILKMVGKNLKQWGIDSEYVGMAPAPAIWEQDLDAFETRKQSVSKQREESFNYLLRSAMSDLTGIRLFPVSSDQAFQNMEDRLAKLNRLFQAVMGIELDHKELKAVYEANSQNIATMQEDRKVKIKQYRALGGKMKHLKGNLQALPDQVREKAVEIRELEKEIETLNQSNRDVRESMGLTDDLLNALGHGKRHIVGEHQKGHFRSEVSLVPGIYQRIRHNQKTVLEIITKLRDKVYGYGNWGDTITPREVADDATATMVMDILDYRKRERARMFDELQSAYLTLMEKQMALDPVLVKEVEDLKKSTSIPKFREYRMQAIENSIADLLDEIHSIEGLVDSEDAKPEELRSSYEQVYNEWVTYQKNAEEMEAEMKRFASMHEEIQKFIQWQKDVSTAQQSVIEAEKSFEVDAEEEEIEKSEAEQRIAELEAKSIHVRRFADYYERAKQQQHHLKLKRARVVDALRSKEIDQAQAEEAMAMIDMELEEVDETHYFNALEAQYKIFKKLDFDELEMSNAEFRRHLKSGPIGAARAISDNYNAMLQMANNNQERLQEMLDQYNRELHRLMAKPNVQDLFYVERIGPEFNPDVYEQQQLDIQKKNQEAQEFLSQGKEQESQRAELQVEALKEQFEFSQQALKLWREAKPFVMNYLYLNEPAYKEVASSYFQENERYHQVERALDQTRDRLFELRGSESPGDQTEAARLESQKQQLEWMRDNAFPIRRLLKGESDLKPGFVRQKIDELEASLDLVSEYFNLKSDLDSTPVESESEEEEAAREARLDQARRDREEIEKAGLAFDNDEKVKAYRKMVDNYEQMNEESRQFRDQLLYLSARLVDKIGEEAGLNLDEEMNPYQDFIDEQMSSEEALKYQSMIDETDLEIERLQARSDQSEEAAALWAQIDSLQKRRVSLKSLVKLKPTTSLDVDFGDEEFEDEENPSAVLRIITDLGERIDEISGKLEDYYPDVRALTRRREHALGQLELMKKKARAEALRTTVGLMDAPRPEDVKAKEQEVRDAKDALDAAKTERNQYADDPERPKYVQANKKYLQAQKELDRKKAEYRKTSANVIGVGRAAESKNPIQDIQDLNEKIKALQARQREVLSDPDRVDELPELRQEIDDAKEKMRMVSRSGTGALRSSKTSLHGTDKLRVLYGDLYRLYRERDSFMGKDPATEEELEELTATREQLHLQQGQAAREGDRALESQLQDEIDKIDAEREKILTLSKYDGNLALDEYRAAARKVRELRADRQVLQAAYNDALVIGPSADPEQIRLEIGKINVKIDEHRQILRQWNRETMMKTMAGDRYDELSETLQDLEEIRYLTNKKNSLQTKLIGLSGLKAPDRARFYLREVAWLLCNDADRDLYKPTPEHVGLGSGVENVLIPMTQRYEEFRKDFSPAKKTCNHGKAPGGSASQNPKFGMDRKKLRGKFKLADDDKLTEDERDDPSGKWLGIYSPKVPNTHLTQTLYRSKSMAEQIARENEQTGDNRPVPLIPFYRRDEFPADDLEEVGKDNEDGSKSDDAWILSSVYQCPYKGIIQVSGRRCPQCGQNTIDRNGVKCANPDCGFAAEAADLPNVACYTCGRQLFEENEDWPNRTESMTYQSKFEAGAPIRFMTAAEMQNIQDRAIVRELYGALMQTLHDFVAPIKAFVPPERITGQNRSTRGRTPRENSRTARADLNYQIRALKEQGGSIWLEQPMYNEDGSPVLDDEGNQKMERMINPRLQSAYDRALWFDSNLVLDDPTENNMEKMPSGKRQARVGSGRAARGGERKRFRRVKRGLADSLIQPGDKVCISEIQDRNLVGLTGIVKTVDPVTYEAIVEFDKNDRVADRLGRFYFHELELLEREVVQELSHLIESVFTELQ